MARIAPVTKETATGKAADILQNVEKKMGKVPNLIATMVQSPAVAQAYLGLSQALSGGSLSPRLREQLALAVGEANSCEYCVAAHTALGQAAGLSEEETVQARTGSASDAKENAAIEFARKVVRERGWVSDEDLDQARNAGLSDGEILEVIGAVAVNTLTNYVNHVAGTEVDFPAAPQLQSA